MSINSNFKKIISQEMAVELKKYEKIRKYFYPLAEPTYGPEEVMEALESMTSFKTSMWDKVREFERLFGEKYGGEAIMVNSGSSADLLVAFGLLDKSGGSLKPGDEILVPAVTWPTHLWSLVMAGFHVKLVDVDINSLNFDITQLRSAIGPKTRGIFIVHLLGNTGDMDKLQMLCKEKNLILLEDTCESLGSKFKGKYLGSFGMASTFSFFFSHHLVTMEGGMILTSDSDFANRIRLLRSHGWTRYLRNSEFDSLDSIQNRYNFVSWGFNVRPTELQAGFGLEQMKRIDKFHKLRIENAHVLRLAIAKYSDYIRTMIIDERVECSWFAFPILVEAHAPFTRDSFSQYLENSGVETRPIVAGNLARLPFLSRFPEVEFGELANADFIHEQGLYIGLHPTTSKNSLLRLVEIIDSFFQQLGGLH